MQLGNTSFSMYIIILHTQLCIEKIIMKTIFMFSHKIKMIPRLNL